MYIMQSIRRFFLKPINFYVFWFLLYSIFALLAGMQGAPNYILAAGLGGCLSLIMLLVDYRGNFKDPKSALFKVGNLTFYIIFIVLVLGIFWHPRQDNFFLVLVGIYSLGIAAGLIFIQFRYKREVVWS
jgi:hypothetical protein